MCRLVLRACADRGGCVLQIVDIQSEGKKVPVETLEWIHTHKTAALLESSVVCGAIVAGASDEDIERVRKYAINIGLAFQVRASLATRARLRQFHNADRTSLAACFCLPVLVQVVSAHHTPSVLQVIDDILDITQSSEQLGKTAGKDLDAEKSTYPSLVGLEESKAIAKRLTDEAKALLDGYDEAARAPLVGLADYIYLRQN